MPCIRFPARMRPLRRTARSKQLKQTLAGFAERPFSSNHFCSEAFPSDHRCLWVARLVTSSATSWPLSTDGPLHAHCSTITSAQLAMWTAWHHKTTPNQLTTYPSWVSNGCSANRVPGAALCSLLKKRIMQLGLCARLVEMVTAPWPSYGREPHKPSCSFFSLQPTALNTLQIVAPQGLNTHLVHLWPA